ncbi:hypothetical protein HMPREF1985_01971 [Mitsuokella sp. oral taxon 131 str. W9106]|nr:hypothetical protein HMPREF1985_01971 [Mitsuokella sp. oral taxon 131 str. W9106]
MGTGVPKTKIAQTLGIARFTSYAKLKRGTIFRQWSDLIWRSAHDFDRVSMLDIRED